MLLHGYSDVAKSLHTWARKLANRGVESSHINICNYISLNNEITIPDIGEGLDRAIEDMGWRADDPFDAIVHSTGMLVIRAWLSNNSRRPRNLKHLVGLAPATWGSPLAHKGRSWLGALFKGNRQLGPDFLNAGDRILSALELGSRFTWELAHRDLLSETPLFTTGAESPYVAVFIGNEPYRGVRALVDEPGRDGTVRWAGCALNTRKISVDLRKAVDGPRVRMSDWANTRLDIRMFAVDGKNHESLLSEPTDDLAERVVKFFDIESDTDYRAWSDETKLACEPALQKMKTFKGHPNDGWQQFVTHVVDEYGQPVTDYVIDLFTADPTGNIGGELDRIEISDFDLDVHAYGSDRSYRAFHMSLPLGTIESGQPSLWMRLSASSGTELIGYRGYAPESKTITAEAPVILNIKELAKPGASLFYPFTTTLVEITLNREPLPFQGQTRLLSMTQFDSTAV